MVLSLIVVSYVIDLIELGTLEKVLRRFEEVQEGWSCLTRTYRSP